MAQTYQPKQYLFIGSPEGISLSGLDTAGKNLSLETRYPIVGEVLEVFWQYNRAGSLYIRESGTGRELFRRNDASGAAGWQYAYPRVFGETTTAGQATITLGSSASSQGVPTQYAMSAVNPLIVSISGAASGSQPLSIGFMYR